MKLWIIRHAHAEDGTGCDFSRNLDARGIEQCEKLAEKIAGHPSKPELILSSPLNRALQTAEELCRHAKWLSPVIQDWISCGMSPRSAMRELAAFSEFSSIAIVGHQPDLSYLIGHLCDRGDVEVKKAQAYLLVDFDLARQTAELSASYLP